MALNLRLAWVAIRLLIIMTVLLGLIYPLALVGIGRVVPFQADGSLITDDSGAVVGSALIGQSFIGPQWFHSRPSAAGANGYDAMASGGSNLGPNNPDLLRSVNQLRAAIAAEDGVDPGDVPPDALTSSGSGLDPDISPAYAQLQVRRVAAARGMSAEQVQALVATQSQGWQLGFMGQPRVNVLSLNLALLQAAGNQRTSS